MTIGAPVYRSKSQAKLVVFVVFGVVTVFVTYMKNQGFFDPASSMAQHYAPGLQFLLVHGLFGVVAMSIGALQLSNRLRARYLSAHRILGYVYAACVFVAAPFAIPLAMKIDSPSLVAASAVQAFGWVVSTAVALYACASEILFSTAAG